MRVELSGAVVIEPLSRRANPDNRLALSRSWNCPLSSKPPMAPRAGSESEMTLPPDPGPVGSSVMRR